MKQKQLSFKFLLIFCLLFSLTTNAQIKFGIHNLTLITDLSFATPKNEMANYYSIGDAMKVYLDAGVSVVQVKYGKNSPFAFDVEAFLGHEKANFDPADYVSNGLDAKITSYGLRLKPLCGSDKRNLLTSLIGGFFVEIGKSNARFIEEGQADVIRHPDVIGYGFTPAIPINGKTRFLVDLAFRNYNWTNNSHTTSTIHTFRTGLGLQFNL